MENFIPFLTKRLTILSIIVTKMLYRKRKLTYISGAKTGPDSLQIVGSRALFYPISIMPQISTEVSGILRFL